MKLLPKPELAKGASEIYAECVNSFRDNMKREKLIRCQPLVQTDSQNYENLIPMHIEDFQTSSLPANVTADDLVNVYKQKFAKEKTPGREYYNQLLASTQCGICPICGSSLATTLDHYLPKSKFPTLAVTPSNLIPCCSDCNKNKGSNTDTHSGGLPLHIYFDDPRLTKEIWLYADVSEAYVISFYVQCPLDWEHDLQSRVRKHFSLYGLEKTYCKLAGNELVNLAYCLNTLLVDCGEEELKIQISLLRKSFENTDLNSWKSALFRCLERNIAWLSSHLRRDPLYTGNREETII